MSAWIDKPTPSTNTFEAPTPAPPTAATPVRRRRRHIATRRLIRHVLRARSDAARLLAAFFSELERGGKEVRASSHLVHAYGGRLAEGSGLQDAPDGVYVCSEPRAWRDAREVVQFLRDRGARISDLGHKVAGDWAAATSDGEGEGLASGEGEVEDEVVWVAS